MRLERAGISYGSQKILESITLEINQGEIFVLMGPSGSGKTTLVRGIAGLVPFSEGLISWQKEKGQTGLVFQEPRLFPHMTVLENLAFGLRARRVAKKERNDQAKEFLELLQLAGLENRYPHQLSGGQQQRVSLGRVLLLKPDLLLLDEPFASLDAPLRVQLTDWLYELQKRQGFSILWITHYIDEAFSVADRVGLLMQGRMIQEGVPLDFYQKPSSEKVAAFFSLSNRFSSTHWKRWLGERFPFEKSNEMGWLPANAIPLSFDGSMHPSIKRGQEEDTFVWTDGRVKRVKHETKAQLIIVEIQDQDLEVELNVWDKVPSVHSFVKVGIPLDKIVWYPKGDS